MSHHQALRPIVLQTASEASPVPCLKEPFKYSAAFKSVDYVFLIRGPLDAKRRKDRHLSLGGGLEKRGFWKLPGKANVLFWASLSRSITVFFYAKSMTALYL